MPVRTNRTKSINFRKIFNDFSLKFCFLWEKKVEDWDLNLEPHTPHAIQTKFQ